MAKNDIFTKKNHKYLKYYTINQYYEHLYEGNNINFNEKYDKNVLIIIRMLKTCLKLTFLPKNWHFMLFLLFLVKIQ